MERKKALLLVSGGLDSTLIGYVMKEQDVDLTILFFINPFNMCNGGCGDKTLAQKTADNLNIEFRTQLLEDEYLDLVADPKHGYGKNMNPCIDCRILMLKLAKKMMEKDGYDFIVTGEVLGQRPMSQHLRAMKLIEKEAGLEGLILRPLSANVLKPTIPEIEGWVDRAKLPAINGRSRKQQFELAKKFNINKGDYGTPAGGCRLTHREYSEKLRDLLKHKRKIDFRDVMYLSNGRHFRLTDDFKIIVGRNETENNYLEKLADAGEVKMWAKDHKGPVCVGIGPTDENKIKLMAGICGRYSDYEGVENISFIYYINGIENHLEAFPFEHKRVLEYKI
jgi:tRNA U34 2-thiouridine synthase MnmA/TrmU